MIFAGGTTIAPCLLSLALEKNQKGQIIVDTYLRTKDDKNIYATGDAAALMDKRMKPLPPTAQTAIQSGELAAQNILLSLQHKKLKKSHIKIKGIAIALGGRYAIIDIGKIKIYGYLAYLIKRFSGVRYKWPLKWLASKGFQNIESCEI
jgi:NADH dehydrogenase